MKRELLAVSIGGCGLSAVIFITWYTYRRYVQEEVEKEQNGSPKGSDQTSPRRKLKNVTHCKEKIKTIENRDFFSLSIPRGILLSQGDQPCIMDTEESVQIVKKASPTNSIYSTSSYTSCDENFQQTSGTDSSYSSISETDTHIAVEGAIGLSTYERHDGKTLSDSEFEDLLISPVLLPQIPGDNRMNSNHYQGRSLVDQYETVQTYDPELSPSRVDEQCKSTSDIYSSIVLPLCPNTGKVIPDVNVTNRKKRVDCQE